VDANSPQAIMIFSILLMVVIVSGDASKEEIFIRRLKSKMATQDPKSPEALVRRLQGSGLPEACTNACPAIVDYAQSMMTMMMKYMDTGSENMDTMDMGGMIKEIYGGLCSHTAALECVSSNIDACTVEGQSSDMSIDTLASVVDCFCVACPGSGEASGAFMGEVMNMMMSSLSTGESADPDAATQDKMMTLGCMMIGATECWTQNSDTCAAAMGSGSMNITDMMGGDDGISAEMCQQMGKSTNYTLLASGSENSDTSSSAASPLVGAGLAAMLPALF